MMRFPSPLEGEGGAKRRMRGCSDSEFSSERPLIRLAQECAIHLLPQGEKGNG
jgi:hypothetical protein